MTQEEIRAALAGESDRVEWKQSAADGHAILHTVCALANDLGDSRKAGYLVVGKANDGSVVGIARDPVRQDEEQKKLANRLTSTRLMPTPSFHIELIEEAGAPATIEFVRYDGSDFEAPVVLRKTVTGNLADQLETLWVQLNAHLASVPAPEDGIRTPYRPEYPIEALRELARNLVQHRLYEGTNAPGRVEWFEDRIVFSNPGGPFGQAGQGEFGEHADYRNPTITRWLVELGYVEQLGRGIRLVQRRLEENRNPALEVETDGFTRVTVRR